MNRKLRHASFGIRRLSVCVYAPMPMWGRPMAYYWYFDFRFWRLLLLLFDIERSTWFIYFLITSIIFPNEGVKYMGNPEWMNLIGMPINCVKCWFIEMYTTIYECIILIWNFIHNRFIFLFRNYSFEICYAESERGGVNGTLFGYWLNSFWYTLLGYQLKFSF